MLPRLQGTIKLKAVSRLFGRKPRLQGRPALAERPVCRHISATLLTLQTTEDEMAQWHHRLDGCWVWVNSESWWWTGRPGVLRFTGSQRVRHDWVTELHWTGHEVFLRWHCFSQRMQMAFGQVCSCPLRKATGCFLGSPWHYCKHTNLWTLKRLGRDQIKPTD